MAYLARPYNSVALVRVLINFHAASFIFIYSTILCRTHTHTHTCILSWLLWQNRHILMQNKALLHDALFFTTGKENSIQNTIEILVQYALIYYYMPYTILSAERIYWLQSFHLWSDCWHRLPSSNLISQLTGEVNGTVPFCECILLFCICIQFLSSFYFLSFSYCLNSCWWCAWTRYAFTSLF